MSVYEPLTNVVSLVFRIHVAQTEQTFDILARNVRRPRPEDRNDTSWFPIQHLNYDELLAAISEQLRRPSGMARFPGEQLELQVYNNRQKRLDDVKNSEQLWNQVCTALADEVRRIEFIAAINFSNIHGLSTNNLDRSSPSDFNGESPSDFNDESPSDFNYDEAPSDFNNGETPSDFNNGKTPSDYGETPSDFNNGESPSDFDTESPSDSNTESSSTPNGAPPTDFNTESSSTPKGNPPSDFNNGEPPSDFNGEPPSDFNGVPPSDFDNGESPSDSNNSADPSDFDGASSKLNDASNNAFDEALSSIFNEAFTYQFDGVPPSAPSGVSGPGVNDASSQPEVIATPDDDNEGPPGENSPDQQ